MTSTPPDQEPALSPTSRFTLKPAPGEDAWHSELVFDGVATGRRVAGLRMEAQFSYGDHWLLLLDNDNEFDGALYISLLGTSCEPVDHRELGMLWGVAGFVTNLRIVARDALEFSFYNEHDRWRLTILASPCYVWADWDRRETRQWSKLLSRRWMTLEEVTSD